MLATFCRTASRWRFVTELTYLEHFFPQHIVTWSCCFFLLPYLSCILNLLPNHLLYARVVKPGWVEQQINTCMKIFMCSLWPPQVQIWCFHIWVDGPVRPRGRLVTLDGDWRTGDFFCVVLGRKVFSISSNEEELIFRQERPHTFSLEELMVTVFAVSHQVIDRQAIRLLIMRLDVILRYNVSPQRRQRGKLRRVHLSRRFLQGLSKIMKTDYVLRQGQRTKKSQSGKTVFLGAHMWFSQYEWESVFKVFHNDFHLVVWSGKGNVTNSREQYWTIFFLKVAFRQPLDNNDIKLMWEETSTAYSTGTWVIKYYLSGHKKQATEQPVYNLQHGYILQTINNSELIAKRLNQSSDSLILRDWTVDRLFVFSEYLPKHCVHFQQLPVRCN